MSRANKKILFYTLPHCIPCEEAKPIVSKFAQQHGLKVEEINSQENDKDADVAPTVCLVENGKKVKCIEGFVDAESFRRELSFLFSSYY